MKRKKNQNYFQKDFCASPENGPLFASITQKYACNAEDLGSIPGLGRSSGEGKGYHPLQYSGLENSLYCIIHGVTKSRTRLSIFHSLAHLKIQWCFTDLEIRWCFNSLVFHFCIKLIVFNVFLLIQNCSVFRVDILFFSQDFRQVSHKPISSKNYIDNNYKCCLLMQIHWPNLKFPSHYWLKSVACPPLDPFCFQALGVQVSSSGTRRPSFRFDSFSTAHSLLKLNISYMAQFDKCLLNVEK